MSDDALDAVVRLVAEGRLTAAEAGPILDALAPRLDRTGAGPGSPAAPSVSPAGESGRAIRLEVTDGGRKVVNLRVPLSLGRAVLGQVPGLSEGTARQIRDALDAGVTGPILDVNEGSGDSVRVVIE